MRLLELFEDVETDLDNQRKARDIASAFGAWLKERNEDTPLADVEGMVRMRLGDRLVRIVSAKAIGLPEEYHDLELGVSWKEGDVATDRGQCLVVRDLGQNKRRFIVTMTMKSDPSNEVDVVFRFRWDTLIHEIIHYLDHKRRSKPVRPGGPDYRKAADGTRDQQVRYYNNPFEFNAIYHQGLYDILNDISNTAPRHLKDMLDDYTIFKSRYMPFFDYSHEFNFRSSLLLKNRKKLEKRFYAFYVWVKDLWPDVRAIKNRIEAEKENAAD